MTGVRPSALAGSDEQAALADAVSGFVERAGLTQQTRAALGQEVDRLPASWPSLADQELLALPWDAGVFETCVALEVLGRAVAPGPVLPTLLAGLLIARFGSAELAAKVEAAARDGSFSAAVCINGVPTKLLGWAKHDAFVNRGM